MTSWQQTPQDLMNTALAMAGQAQADGDHPYGAVIISASGQLAERNRVVTTTDHTAHSEIMAIRTAALTGGLEGTAGATLVTSYEPCPMCLGAIVEAGIARLVIGGRRTRGRERRGGSRGRAPPGN